MKLGSSLGPPPYYQTKQSYFESRFTVRTLSSIIDELDRTRYVNKRIVWGIVFYQLMLELAPVGLHIYWKLSNYSFWEHESQARQLLTIVYRSLATLGVTVIDRGPNHVVHSLAMIIALMVKRSIVMCHCVKTPSVRNNTCRLPMIGQKRSSQSLWPTIASIVLQWVDDEVLYCGERIHFMKVSKTVSKPFKFLSESTCKPLYRLLSMII